MRSITVGTLFWLAGQMAGSGPGPEHSSRRRAAQEEAGEPPRDPKGRPTIGVLAGQLPRVIDDGEEATIAADLGLYQRGSLIVRPTRTRLANADGLAQGKTEEEMEKRLGAAWIASDPLVSIDNCETRSGANCSARHSPSRPSRCAILGKSLNAED